MDVGTAQPLFDHPYKEDHFTDRRWLISLVNKTQLPSSFTVRPWQLSGLEDEFLN